MISRAAQVRGAIAEAAWPAPPRVQRSSDRHGATDLAGVAAGSEANQRLQRGSAGSVALHSGGAWRGMRALTAVQRLGPRADRQLALGYTTAADIRLTRPACSFDACFAAAGSRGAWLCSARDTAAAQTA